MLLDLDAKVLLGVTPVRESLLAFPWLRRSDIDITQSHWPMIPL
jgi:hypothetical protein